MKTSIKIYALAMLAALLLPLQLIAQTLQIEHQWPRSPKLLFTGLPHGIAGSGYKTTGRDPHLLQRISARPGTLHLPFLPSAITGNISVIDTAIVVNGVDTSRVVYSFNGAGKRLTALQQFSSKGTWMNLDLSKYTYDSLEHVLSHVTQNWTGAQWVDADSDSYTYIADG